MSGSKALLDSNAVSALFSRDDALGRLIEAFEFVETPFVVAGGVYFGVLNGSKRDENMRSLERLLLLCPMLLPTSKTPLHYGSVRLALRRIGRPIPANDVWIAAQALEHGATLITRDAHFRHVDGLSVMTW